MRWKSTQGLGGGWGGGGRNKPDHTPGLTERAARIHEDEEGGIGVDAILLVWFVEQLPRVGVPPQVPARWVERLERLGQELVAAMLDDPVGEFLGDAEEGEAWGGG